jgi:hypothetical protein
MNKDNVKGGTTYRYVFFWLMLCLCCVAICISWSWFIGKDLNWDSINYHYYVAYQWMENRLDKDFLPASIQSYLNPIAYLPFYEMVKSSWPSLWVSSALATIHSVNLLLIALFTATILPNSLRHRWKWMIASVVLAAINPIFVVEIGSTFNDITTSIFVLAGYVVCFRWLTNPNALMSDTSRAQSGDARTWTIAGLLLGVALGLKLTNLLFALALGILIFARPNRVYDFLYRALFYIVGGVIGFLIVDGYWAWRLWSEFGNPIFPYSNALFLSTDFPSFNIRNYRFVPETLTDALIFPWNAIRVDANIYTETNAPDCRFLAFAFLLTCLICNFSWKRWRAIKKGESEAPISVLPWLLVVWLSLYALWLYTSGNGRYFLPGLLLLGPVIVALFLHFRISHRGRIYAVALLIGWQIIQIKEGTQWRWSTAPWTPTWFEVQVPKELKERPFLYLTPATQTSMFLAPFLHDGSAFSNVGGQVPLTLNGPGGERIRKLLEKYGKNIRSLYPVGRLDDIDKAPDKVLRFYDGIYDRFGLQTDRDSCAVIRRRNSSIQEAISDVTRITSALHPPNSWAISCRLVPILGKRITNGEEAMRVDRVFDEIERKCPRRFDPAKPVTKKLFNGWARTYVNSDFSLLYSSDSGQIQYRFFEGGEPINIGTLVDWESDHVPSIDCSVKKAPPFRPMAAKHAIKVADPK